ncbi:hypothetical protein [Pseudanabaena sp. PCC 6802]|uniref:hypothetical protein n=1 Tax=Pseudanabaena sp. PCC 6802 TaxID=118173 RepID=UPI000344B932|nr:hypothetical protein [Pseudanabaena sp. PCC 6802]
MSNYDVVKKYFAQWLQMGKRVFISNQNRLVAIDRVIKGEGYSDEFERLWAEMSDPGSGDVYLEGTNENVQDLLRPEWETIVCARCDMLVPCLSAGPRDIPVCPCHDLGCFPNLDSIPARAPVVTNKYLSSIITRLEEAAQRNN